MGGEVAQRTADFGGPGNAQGSSCLISEHLSPNKIGSQGPVHCLTTYLHCLQNQKQHMSRPSHANPLPEGLDVDSCPHRAKFLAVESHMHTK